MTYENCLVVLYIIRPFQSKSSSFYVGSTVLIILELHFRVLFWHEFCLLFRYSFLKRDSFKSKIHESSLLWSWILFTPSTTLESAKRCGISFSGLAGSWGKLGVDKSSSSVNKFVLFYSNFVFSIQCFSFGMYAKKRLGTHCPDRWKCGKASWFKIPNASRKKRWHGRTFRLTCCSVQGQI